MMTDMYTSMATSSSSQTGHPALPLSKLKSAGVIAGGLMAVGGALLLPSMLLFFSLLRDEFRYILHEPDPNEGMWVGPDWARLFEPWVLFPFLFGVLFIIIGWQVSSSRLRDSGLTAVPRLVAISASQPDWQARTLSNFNLNLAVKDYEEEGYSGNNGWELVKTHRKLGFKITGPNASILKAKDTYTPVRFYGMPE